MKTLAVVVLALVLGLMLTATVFAQQDETIMAITGRTSGSFKAAVVVNCDAAKNVCVAKTAKEGNQTANMTYAQYNGSFNAAKELKAGDKISGQWTKVKGMYYVTILVKD
jgi:hypothetical protein